jgi:hypothetical protein
LYRNFVVLTNWSSISRGPLTSQLDIISINQLISYHPHSHTSATYVTQPNPETYMSNVTQSVTQLDFVSTNQFINFHPNSLTSQLVIVSTNQLIICHPHSLTSQLERMSSNQLRNFHKFSLQLMVQNKQSISALYASILLLVFTR